MRTVKQQTKLLQEFVDRLGQQRRGVTLYVREKRGCMEFSFATGDEPAEVVSQDYQAG